MQVENNKIYKANITNVPSAEKLNFKNKNCVMTISVGKKYHEDPFLKETLDTIDASFAHCTILVGDILQRHNLKSLLNKSEDEAYILSQQYGDEWLQRNVSVITNTLTIPYSIKRWINYLDKRDFSINLLSTQKIYAENQLFRDKVHHDVNDFLRRSKVVSNHPTLFDNSVAYILEECTCMRYWFDEGYDYEVYPNKRLPSVQYFYEIIEPERSKEKMLMAQVRFDSKKNTPPISQSSQKNSEVFMDKLLMVMPGHIYWKDQGGKYLGLNKTFADNFGKAIKDIIGKTDYDILEYDDANKLHNIDQKVLNSDHVIETEETALINGKARTFLTYKSAVQDDNKKIGIVGASLDITKYKQLEHELREMNKNLLDSYGDKLDFCNYLSHEIKTPLSSLVKIIELLCEDWDQYKDNKQRKKHLDLALRSSTRLKLVLQNLLDVSQYNSDNMAYHYAPGCIINSINAVLLEFANEKNNIKVNAHSPESDLHGTFDHYKIEQVIRNLITNALFHGKGKNTTVEIYSQHDTLRIEVIDQGPGIKKDNLQNVFKLFFQEKKSEGTTGLGLSLAKEIIAGHNGKIWLENNQNKGCKAIFEIPKNIKSNLNQQSSKNTNNNVVLVVDDDEIILEISTMILQKMGFQVISTCNAEEALNVLEQQHMNIRVMIVDMMMSDMSGLDFLEEVKKSEKFKNIPFYIYSGISHSADINKARVLGVTGVLDKVISADAMAKILKKHLL